MSIYKIQCLTCAARVLFKNPWTKWGTASTLSDLLIVGKLVEELADVADAEQRGGVQERQNLDQDLRRQPEEKVTRHYNKGLTLMVFIPAVVDQQPLQVTAEARAKTADIF